ncbi:MAG: hypothetical protein HZA58_10555 [Acidimicrobiia bacterium]|nr:hypothetical protein [Acidimicrobiia bacterium]
MNRLRLFLALVAVALMLGVGPSSAQEAPSGGDTPAVVVDEGAPVPIEDAWTFRYLVPTVLALSGLIVVATVVGYGVRVRGRYRVVR